ncbi:MAG: hypothetical protein U5R06_18225 [candidate division KSB1 bacterium]|nr:hypothetical protein [candidate division KSB1 bacterium]
MLRLLLLGVGLYFVGKIVSGLFKPPEPPVEVHGKGKEDPLNVRDEDIEDVRFVDDETKDRS